MQGPLDYIIPALKVFWSWIITFFSSIGGFMSSIIPQNMESFVTGVTFAALFGAIVFLICLRAISIIVPKWSLSDTFNRNRITNSGLIITAFIISLGMIIASAVY